MDAGGNGKRQERHGKSVECRHGTLEKLGINGEGMKVVILAGGKGTRISEESKSKPKPMVEIAGKPILWHIMKIYSTYGYHDFIICCGYKGRMIKDYFTKYYRYQTDTTFDLENNTAKGHTTQVEPWRVTLADTGESTLTAGRVLKIRDYIGKDENFMLTYGDGVGNINLSELMNFHKACGKVVTISTTQPAGRFGGLKLSSDGLVQGFKEKARKDQTWINIGYMVLNRKVFDYLGEGSEMLEAGPFEKLAMDGQMAAYKHAGFWAPMDTVHDKEYLEELWESGKAPWKIWRDAEYI